MEPFRHEALFYAGEREFVESMSSFIRDGAVADEPTLVVVGAERIRLLREQLGPEGAQVLYADMAEVGSNPARIIPAWREFVDEHGAEGRRLRGIGEPIGPERGHAELVECHRHEALLNLAFAGSDGFWLLCPYDTVALEPEVIEEAYRTHPAVVDGERRDSAAYRGVDEVARPFSDPLPEPKARPEILAFTLDNLRGVRQLVSWRAKAAGIMGLRSSDLQLAVDEVASNSVTHGGGGGLLRIWLEGGTLISEVMDRGLIDDPMAGRTRPALGQIGGRGLWLANQVCDLVQLRATPAGSVIRLHMTV